MTDHGDTVHALIRLRMIGYNAGLPNWGVLFPRTDHDWRSPE